LSVVKYLIEQGVDPNCKEYGYPALCSAASEGNNKVIEFLVSSGAG
jgi:ankyrin repeat protein